MCVLRGRVYRERDRDGKFVQRERECAWSQIEEKER